MSILYMFKEKATRTVSKRSQMTSVPQWVQWLFSLGNRNGRVKTRKRFKSYQGVADCYLQPILATWCPFLIKLTYRSVCGVGRLPSIFCLSFNIPTTLDHVVIQSCILYLEPTTHTVHKISEVPLQSLMPVEL